MLSFSPRDVLDEILDLTESVSEGFPTYFSKYIDKASNHRPAAKLHYSAIRDENISWIQSFHAARIQQVVGRHLLLLSSRIPQGTELGRLLFLVYINDLPSKISSLVRLFYCTEL